MGAVVLARGDQLGEIGAGQCAGLDDLAPAAEIARLDAVGDQAV